MDSERATEAIKATRATKATVDPGTAWIMRTGGLAALLLAVGYVATMPLFAIVGAPPEGALARIEFHETGTTAWAGIVSLSILTDMLFVPVAVALYAVLRRWNQPAALVTIAFIFLFVVLDLAVLWPAKVSVITLGEEHAAASLEQQASLVTAARYPAAVLDSPLTAIYSILTLGIGILASGLVMRGVRHWRTTAAVAIATGVVSLASVIEAVVTGTFPVLVVAASLLTIVWLVMVGRGLMRLHGTALGDG